MPLIKFKYNRRKFNFLKTKTFSIYKFYNFFLDNHRIEAYTREMIKVIQKINKTYNQKFNEKVALF